MTYGVQVQPIDEDDDHAMIRPDWATGWLRVSLIDDDGDYQSVEQVIFRVIAQHVFGGRGYARSSRQTSWRPDHSRVSYSVFIGRDQASSTMRGRDAIVDVEYDVTA